jgi:hypothetical protein
MATQNLVSAALSAELRSDALAKLASVKQSLDFLVSLNAGEKQSLFKTGANYLPFVEKAHNLAFAHPEILSPSFDAEEFKRDFALSKDLVAIADQAKALADSLGDTLVAVNSDAIAGALEVYSFARINADHVPGVKVACAELAEFFKKPRRKA